MTVEEQKLYDAIYRACLYSLQQLGPDMYKLSWFGQWKRGRDV